jgi:hypothetical protein
MKNLKLILIVACGLAMAGAAQAATIFSDNFSDTNASKVNWNQLAAAGFSASYSSKGVTLKNPDTTYTAFFIHSFATAPSIFTLSAQFTIADATVNGAGLMYCFSDNPGVQGYTLQLGTSQYLFCFKYAGTAESDLKNQFNPFVKQLPGTNVLMVSKTTGNVFNVFCNGHYITRFSDNQFANGDIAVLVPPSSTIIVDSVLVTDQATNPPASACYADSFLTTASAAWSSPSAGEASFGGGQLVLNNTDSVYSSTIYVDGISPSASIEAIVSHKSGAGGYGVAFVESDSNRIVPFAFLVDSLRRYSVVNPDSPTVSSHLGHGIIYGALGTDTLEVLQFGTKCVFLVNGAAQDTVAIPSDFRIDGAGLYASPKTAVICTKFIAGGDSTGARCPSTAVSTPGHPLVNARVLPPVFGKGSVVYDMRGRRIGVFDRASFERANIVSGLYFVVPAGQKVGSAAALRVMKTGN